MERRPLPAEVKVNCKGGSLTVVMTDFNMLLSGNPVISADGLVRRELLAREVDTLWSLNT